MSNLAFQLKSYTFIDSLSFKYLYNTLAHLKILTARQELDPVATANVYWCRNAASGMRVLIKRGSVDRKAYTLRPTKMRGEVSLALGFMINKS